MLRPRYLTLFTQTRKTEADPALEKARSLQYAIDWSPADQQFRALCKKFPDISFLAGTREAALDGAKTEVARFLSR